jgi:hypothetical protein
MVELSTFAPFYLICKLRPLYEGYHIKITNVEEIIWQVKELGN